MLVEHRIIVEAKATHRLRYADKVQLMHYLAAMNLEVGLLLHFGRQRNSFASLATIEISTEQARELGLPESALIAPPRETVLCPTSRSDLFDGTPTSSGKPPEVVFTKHHGSFNEDALMPSGQFGSSGSSDTSGLLDRHLDQAKESRITRI
jgi:hypothetical protein